MNATFDTQQLQHKSNVFPVDFQERIGRSNEVVRELRSRGISVLWTDAASGERPTIEINPTHAHLITAIGRGHRMVRSDAGVIAHGLIINECEVIWYAQVQPKAQRAFA